MASMSSLLKTNNPETDLIKAEKVNLSVYYSTLSSPCPQFILNELIKVFDGDLVNIVNLRLVPYGHTFIRDPNGTVVCYRDDEFLYPECYLSSIQACAIEIWPDVKQHFKFIHCFENQWEQIFLRQQTGEDAWRSCSQKLGLDQKPVQSCYDSGLEHKLLQKYANETDSLVPPQEFIPWVVVNKEPLRRDYKNYVSYVCKAYKGSPKPEACRSLSPKVNSAGKGKQNDDDPSKGG